MGYHTKPVPGKQSSHVSRWSPEAQVAGTIESCFLCHDHRITQNGFRTTNHEEKRRDTPSWEQLSVWKKMLYIICFGVCVYICIKVHIDLMISCLRMKKNMGVWCALCLSWSCHVFPNQPIYSMHSPLFGLAWPLPYCSFGLESWIFLYETTTWSQGRISPF